MNTSYWLFRDDSAHRPIKWGHLWCFNTTLVCIIWLKLTSNVRFTSSADLRLYRRKQKPFIWHRVPVKETGTSVPQVVTLQCATTWLAVSGTGWEMLSPQGHITNFLQMTSIKCQSKGYMCNWTIMVMS